MAFQDETKGRRLQCILWGNTISDSTIVLLSNVHMLELHFFFKKIELPCSRQLFKTIFEDATMSQFFVKTSQTLQMHAQGFSAIIINCFFLFLCSGRVSLGVYKLLKQLVISRRVSFIFYSWSLSTMYKQMKPFKKWSWNFEKG